MLVLSILFFIVLGLYIALARYVYGLVEKRYPKRRYLLYLTTAFFIILPFFQIFVSYTLGAFYYALPPYPKTKIIKKVKYPISIYWEDNVYPGFSKEDRKLMIENYLDGIHLKTMALNAPDGKIYVYNCSKDEKLYEQYLQEKKEYEKRAKLATKELRKVSEKLGDFISRQKLYRYSREEFEKLPKTQQERFFHLYNIWMDPKKHADIFRDKYYLYIEKTPQFNKLYTTVEQIKQKSYDLEAGPKGYFLGFTQKCMQSEKIFTKETMPKTNYTVTFNEIPLNFLSKHFLYSDETKVIENNTSKVIAYNRRYMALQPIFPPNLHDVAYYLPEPVCGERISLAEVTFEHNKWNFNNRRLRWVDINQKLYNKYIKGEK